MAWEKASGSNREAESTDAPGRGELLRSSDEAGVMPWSEGGRSPPLGASQLATGGAPILNGRRQPSRGGFSNPCADSPIDLVQRNCDRMNELTDFLLGRKPNESAP